MGIDLAVIGGTGLYQLDGVEIIERNELDTPYGKPSSPISLARLGGRTLAFLARHGEQHEIAPHKVNYRANVWALRQAGAERVLAINAVGGIREDMGPRAVIVPHQLIDYTWGRVGSYCDSDGAKVEHVDFTEPYDAKLRQSAIEAATAAGIDVVRDGVYGCTQGPRLETAAEIARMRRDGCDLVGMTGMPEAALARELSLPYACVALVANWAAGCGDEATISLDEIFEHLRHATRSVLPILRGLVAAG